MFNSGSFQDLLDQALFHVEGKRYHSGVAKHWIDSIAIEACSKEQFVFADLLCYNYAVYGKTYLNDWKWFPITYLYENAYHSLFVPFAKKLVSKQQINIILPVFGFDTVESFIENYKKKHSLEQFREHRFLGAFESAAVLGFIVKPEAIGTLP